MVQCVYRFRMRGRGALRFCFDEEEALLGRRAVRAVLRARFRFKGRRPSLRIEKADRARRDDGDVEDEDDRDTLARRLREPGRPNRVRVRSLVSLLRGVRERGVRERDVRERDERRRRGGGPDDSDLGAV